MKISPRADYPVGVRPRAWEEPPDAAPYYDGVFDVALNGMVTVTFVPDMSAYAPPFDAAALPDDLDQVSSVKQARLAAALLASYAVTPHPTRQGTTQQLPAIGPTGEPPGPDDIGGVVFYVDPSRFAAVESDLVELSTRLGGRHPDATVSTLRTHPAIDLIESTVLTSPAFAEQDRSWLRDAEDQMGPRGLN